MSTLDEKSSSSKGFTLAMIALAVAGVAGIVFLATQRQPPETLETQTATVQFGSEGENLEIIQPLSANAQDSELGKVMPTISGTDFDDKKVEILPDGNPKVIYYLAHSCPFCQEEVKTVQKLINDGQVPEGLEIYSISTLVNSRGSKFPPEKWLEGEGWTPPVILDDQASTLFSSSGGSGTPYTVALDGENKITNRVSGKLSEQQTIQFWESAANEETAGTNFSPTEFTPQLETDTEPDDSETSEETENDETEESEGSQSTEQES